jgi:acyl dehydratase
MDRYFEDLTIGETHISGIRTVTEHDITRFAELSGDYTGLHVNDAAAGATPFGGRIAHGALVFALAGGLAFEMGTISNTVVALRSVERMRFIRPVRPCDSVYVTKTVAAKRDDSEFAGIVTFNTQVVNQDDQLVMALVESFSIRRRTTSR